MILLTIIGIGFLSLASISLRSSSQGTAMATARANARMSLMLAIGELQRQVGADTRVTARADILNKDHPPVLGAWRSWEGTNHETSGPFLGRPKSPGSDYRTVKESRFLAWLTSADSAQSLLASIPSNDKITLLGKGSVGSGTDPVTAVDRDKLQIHLPPTLVSTGKQPGAMAWWVGGENQKAYLPKPETEPRGAVGRKQAVLQAKSHSTVDPKPYGLESVLTDPERGRVDAKVNKSLTLAQVDLLSPAQSDEMLESRRSREFFHDLSTSSVGLLTNTATGGWRKDMSLLAERWTTSGFPKAQLPFFRVSSDAAVTAGSFSEEASLTKTGSLFYPWSNYTTFGPGGPVITQHPVASWNSLMDFVSYYKKGSVSTTSVRTLDSWSARRVEGGAPESYRHLHTIHPYPVVARIQWVFSHFSEKVPDPAAPANFLYNPKLLVTPIITLWNPYNVKLRQDTDLYFDFKLMPVSLSYQMKDTENTRYNSIINVDGATPPMPPFEESLIKYSGGAVRIQYSIATTGTIFNPGQTIVYSPAQNIRKVPNNASGTPVPNQIPLEKGFRFTGGHLYPLKHGTDVISMVPGSTQMKVRARFDTVYKKWMWAGSVLQPEGVGFYTQIGSHPDPHNQQVQYLRSAYSPALADQLYPKILESNINSPTVSEVELVPKPFLSTIFGSKFATKTKSSLITQYDIKGLAQSTPFGNWANSHYRDEIYAYSGTGHPHTSRFTYSFVTYTSAGNNDYPGSGPAPDNNGYIVTGEQSDRGMPRAVVAELPSRPMASLGELNHWDLRFENPAPPFAFNIIGNSDASPLLPPNAVFNSAEANKMDNFRHDDFYCANHLLFDDWFFSSITEDPATFGGLPRNQAAVYGEFVTGVTPLANRAYKPLLEDQAFVASNPSAKLYADYVNTNDSWKTIASRLEVEGMFNINSTSVTAWRALLGHARNQKVLHLTSTGNYTGDGAAKQYPVSRFTISGEAEAGTPVAGAFLEASQVTGYRTLTEDFLDDLAEEVVKQVRLRGPFLSLAEFINRQLSSGDLALAGALQAAFNELTKEGAANNPLVTIQGLSSKTVKNPPEGAAAEDKIGYVFSEAAEGYSCYGVPGWTRQADILRPLAPILTARDDTFVIRGYGDARDTSGKVTATAICEAVVRRTRDYVDAADAAETNTSLTREVNKKFGRRFEIVSFRWLSHEEV